MLVRPVKKSRIVSVNIDNLTFKDSIDQVREWGLKRQSGFVCFANVHMIIEAYQDSKLRADLEKALLVLPDGKPLAVACEWLYKTKQERVSGMDFMPALLREINLIEARIFLFGSTEQVLELLEKRISQEFPRIKVVGSVSPPFRKLRHNESQEFVMQINKSEANFVLVALGCPKQERWMAENSSKISGVMLGFGGAFPVVAGIQKRCPVWMQKYGLEWFYRLLLEPRRLFRRYFVTNFKFLFLFLKQVFKPLPRDEMHFRYQKKEVVE